MNCEDLALRMRQRAIAIEDQEIQSLSFEQEKKKLAQQKYLDSIKKLYFHTGRWAGGARDNTARQAFQKVSLS